MVVCKIFLIIMKWKCKKCGHEKEITCKDGHKLEKHKEGARCTDCKLIIDPPSCCDEKMYIAS